MKYEDIIRKFFKTYKSKREMKNELERVKNELGRVAKEPVKIIRETCDVIPIKCKRRIDRYDINYLNEQEKDAMYARVKYSIEKEMFNYLIENKIIKFEEIPNFYDGVTELIGYMKVVR